MKPKVTAETRALIKKHALKGGGICLDFACGYNKQPGFVGMDKRNIKGVVDIVHDIEKFPYPLPDESCATIVASHIIEHIKPWLMMNLDGNGSVFDELWRIMKVNGQLMISMPYGGSFGYMQDPTHCNQRNEATWTYYDPDYELYAVYYPKPWKIERNVFNVNGNMEVILAKRPESYRGPFSTPELARQTFAARNGGAK